METRFSAAQLADPNLAEAEQIIRKCVHCGFCTATCPSYVTLGNELDSPRGRIYLIKDMLENDRPADRETTIHLDRCLSCLACTTTCPSGVDYRHLIDHARAHVEKTYRRPLFDRLIRNLLAAIMPEPGRFRFALSLAPLGRPFVGLFRKIPGLSPLAAMIALAPDSRPPPLPGSGPGRFAPTAPRRGKVIMQAGCVQSVLGSPINAAAISLLNRVGVEVVLAEGEGCCGSLTLHMGREEDARRRARALIERWEATLAEGGYDAIVTTASGCGATIKDYRHLFAGDPVWAPRAKAIADRTLDVTEYVARLDLPRQSPRDMVVAYHSSCSLQHGQKITALPKQLLEAAGFTVREPAEGHLCCGSAGTYNMLQPKIAASLKARKLGHIERLKPDVIAAGNLGCLTQLSGGAPAPLVHTIELLNWAHGGAKPAALE